MGNRKSRSTLKICRVHVFRPELENPDWEFKHGFSLWIKSSTANEKMKAGRRRKEGHEDRHDAMKLSTDGESQSFMRVERERKFVDWGSQGDQQKSSSRGCINDLANKRQWISTCFAMRMNDKKNRERRDCRPCFDTFLFCFCSFVSEILVGYLYFGRPLDDFIQELHTSASSTWQKLFLIGWLLTQQPKHTTEKE